MRIDSSVVTLLPPAAPPDANEEKRLRLILLSAVHTLEQHLATPDQP